MKPSPIYLKAIRVILKPISLTVASFWTGIKHKYNFPGRVGVKLLKSSGFVLFNLPFLQQLHPADAGVTGTAQKHYWHLKPAAVSTASLISLEVLCEEDLSTERDTRLK